MDADVVHVDSMSKKTHTHTIFPEPYHLSVGECMHQTAAALTAESGSQNMDGVGAEVEVRVGFLKQG